MTIRDLAGTGALQDALLETNTLLAGVLKELQQTNGQRLELIAAELTRLNEKVDVALRAPSEHS